MSIVDNVKEQEYRLEKIEEILDTRKKSKDKKITIKIPKMMRTAVKRDGDVSIALWLGHNHRAIFKKAMYRDGLIYVGDQSYGYEEACIYHLKMGKKILPFIVVFEWRLLAVGGKAETIILDGEKKADEAETLKITNYAQKIMVRRLEQAEMDSMKSKKSGVSIIVWVILLGVGAYVISKLFGA